MTTISLTNQRGSLRARTIDSIAPWMLAPTEVTPAPPVDVGSRVDGTGKTPTALDLAALRAARNTTGLLSPSARAEMDRILAKYSGNAAAGPTPAAGITSNDAVRANVENNRAVAKIHADFWAPRLAAQRADIFGR